jgi:hypothetical protein
MLLWQWAHESSKPSAQPEPGVEEDNDEPPALD